jgi:hypothetical protein
MTPARTEMQSPASGRGSAKLKSAVVQQTKYTAIGDPVERLLSHLDKVRKSGRGWTARCPAHEDRTASLSVAAGDDGRVLLHCFAGCSAPDVLAALGLDIGDLFVRKPTASMSFAERAALKQHAKQAQWAAALNVLSFKSTIVRIVAAQLSRKEPLSDEDHARFDLACERISSARVVLNAR